MNEKNDINLNEKYKILYVHFHDIKIIELILKKSEYKYEYEICCEFKIFLYKKFFYFIENIEFDYNTRKNNLKFY